MIEDDPIN